MPRHRADQSGISLLSRRHFARQIERAGDQHVTLRGQRRKRLFHIRETAHRQLRVRGKVFGCMGIVARSGDHGDTEQFVPQRSDDCARILVCQHADDEVDALGDCCVRCFDKLSTSGVGLNFFH